MVEFYRNVKRLIKSMATTDEGRAPTAESLALIIQAREWFM